MELQVSLADVRGIESRFLIWFLAGLNAMVILIAVCTVFLASSVFESIKFISFSFGLGKRLCCSFFWAISAWYHTDSTYFRRTSSFRRIESIFVCNGNFREVKSHHQFAKLDFVNQQSFVRRQWNWSRGVLASFKTTISSSHIGCHARRDQLYEKSSNHNTAIVCRWCGCAEIKFKCEVDLWFSSKWNTNKPLMVCFIHVCVVCMRVYILPTTSFA